MTRPRLENDCETPSVLPCSPVPAYLEIRLVKDGVMNALPIANRVAEIISVESPWIIGTRSKEMRKEIKPAIINDFSPNFFASLPITPPWIIIPIIPT